MIDQSPRTVPDIGQHQWQEPGEHEIWSPVLGLTVRESRAGVDSIIKINDDSAFQNVFER
ncbi:hypothetical protein ACHAXS_003382 [Conticribra weissflogii]